MGCAGRLHSAQLWIALPDAERHREPDFHHYPDLPLIERGGFRITVLAGSCDGERSPAKVYTPIVGLELSTRGRAQMTLPLDAGFEHAALTLEGAQSLNGELLEPGTLLYLGGAEDPRRAEIVAEARLLYQEISRSGMDNPRALWIIGGYQLGAPPPLGGQPDKAAATMRQGLEAARAEALSTTPRAPHDPVWGAAENLMNLAYLHSHSTLANRDLAFAYAAGALAVVPEWHYVKDVLWPQIEAMAPGR